MFTTIAFALLLQTAPLPAQDDVRQALADQLALACGEDEACAARQPAVEVRAVACRATGEDAASCRYEHRAGTGAWRAAETSFRFDIETQLWLVDSPEVQ